MSTNDTTYNDLFPSKFLKADDVDPAIVVQVKSVAQEPVGEDQEEKPIVYFHGQLKGLVLNKTNAGVLVSLSGSEKVHDWLGLSVEAYKAIVPFRGKLTAAIRLREPSKNGAGDTDDIPNSFDDEPVRSPNNKRKAR